MSESATPSDAAFVVRMGELKELLFEEATGGVLASTFRDFVGGMTAGAPVESREQWIDLADNFLFEYPLPDGRRPVERFADEAAGLSEEERATLRRWVEPRLGVFELLDRDEASLRLYNLVNEVEYRVVPSRPIGELSRIRDGMFVVTAIVPVRDFFTFTGNQRAFRRSDAEAARRLAFEMVGRVPRAAFVDNPERLARAWELQKRQHEEFLEHFGSDQVVVRGSEAAPRWERYQEWLRERRAAERGEPARPERVMQLPTSLDRAETVGIVSDPVEGIGFVVDLGGFLEAVRDPDGPNGVLGRFLESPQTGPGVFRRAAESYPETFSRALGRLLGRPDFEARRDLEPLLRERKAAWFARKPVPRVVPARAGRPEARGRRWRPVAGESAPAPGDACPCGSGRKFKKCCMPR